MSERQMTIWLLVVMGVAIVGGCILLYVLRFQTLDTLNEELTVIKGQVEEAQAKKAKIKFLEDRKAALTKSIDAIRQQIPVFNPKEENDQWAELVDSIRQKTRVMVSGARFSAAKSGSDPIPDSIFRARYELRVSGGFFELLNYLNHLETERRFLVADSIKLSAGGADARGSASPVRELSMSLSTFMQRPQQAPPPPPGAKPPTDKPVEQPTPEETRRVTTPIPE